MNSQVYILQIHKFVRNNFEKNEKVLDAQNNSLEQMAVTTQKRRKMLKSPHKFKGKCPMMQAFNCTENQLAKGQTPFNFNFEFN